MVSFRVVGLEIQEVASYFYDPTHVACEVLRDKYSFEHHVCSADRGPNVEPVYCHFFVCINLFILH